MERKTCLACKEDIAFDATRCPHCSSYQKFWVRLLRNPVFLIVLFVGVMSLTYIPMLSMFPDYTHDPQGTVEIMESEFQISDSSCDNAERVDVIGKLKNLNSETIRRMTFSLEFFDESGKTVEFVTDQEHELVVEAGTVSTFKVGGRITTDPSLYKSHKVTVIEAKIGGVY